MSPSSPESFTPYRETRIQPEQPPAESISEAESKPVAQSGWLEPTALVEQFDTLAGTQETAVWAVEVKETLKKLGTMAAQGSQQTPTLVTKLASLRKEGDNLAGRIADASLSKRVHRAGFALARRVDVWQQLLSCGGLVSTEDDALPADPAGLALCLADVGAVVHHSPQGEAWGKYLELDNLRELTGRRRSADAERNRLVARSVFDRLNRSPLNRAQRQFLSRSPLAALRSQLRVWATEPVRAVSLLRNVERYERTGTPADAMVIAQDCQRLAMSPAANRRQLGRSLETWYRNANLRLVVGDELLNRLIPERAAEYAAVDDVVLGNRVVGQSRIDSNVSLRLVPDSSNLHLALEVRGQVASLTQSTAGPATFLNDSQATYRAWKEIEIGSQGLVLRPAEVSVDNDVRLRRVSTHFDGIPLVGSLVKEVARSQHESRRCEMNCEAEEKVYAQAKRQINGETDAQAERIGQAGAGAGNGAALRALAGAGPDECRNDRAPRGGATAAILVRSTRRPYAASDGDGR